MSRMEVQEQRKRLVLNGLFRQPKQMLDALTLIFFMCKKTLSLFVYCSGVFCDL